MGLRVSIRARVKLGCSVRVLGLDGFKIRVNPFTGAGDFFRHWVVELFKNS